MKSIVLCERTLGHESEDFTLKDGQVDEEDQEKAEEKKLTNGSPENEKSETVINNSSDAGQSDRHGNSDTSEMFSQEKVSGGERRLTNETENGIGENSSVSGSDSSVIIEENNSCGDEDNNKDCVVSKGDCLVGKETTEGGGGGARDSSERVQDLNSNRKSERSDLEVESSDGVSENVGKSESKTVGEGKVENSLENSDGGLVSRAPDPAAEKVENAVSVVNIDSDVDENKENEKDCKRDDAFPENEVSSKESNGCEIQVGDVQSMSGSEKDCMWAENDFKSCPQNQKETGDEKFTERSQNDYCINESAAETEKENLDLEVEENAESESEESMQIEEIEEGNAEGSKETDEKEEEVVDEKKRFKDLDKLRGKTKTKIGSKNRNCQEKKENACRKRHLSDSGAVDSTAKKKRCSTDSEEKVPEETENENVKGSSRCEDLASLDTVGVSSEGRTSPEPGTAAAKRTSDGDDDKSEKKQKVPVGGEDQKEGTRFSVLEKFRGSLKSLSRGDLEELIVQKLCEVITERSNVGELRLKAQALEQDQERWKTKVQSLTKQVREMEMVMKKYMTEVQKQVKEGDTHVVTPLKVTRSVGLQVSFYSSASKGPKPSSSQPSTPPSPAQNISVRNPKGTPPKLSLQLSPANQNVRNTSFQKNSPTLQKSPVGLQRRSIVPKPDYLSSQANRAVQQSLLNSSRGASNQGPRTSYKSISGVTTSGSNAQQQQQQNSSKVIDLTDDDDRQPGSVAKTSGSIRVVNHLPQGQGPQGNRFAYLLPTTSASTASSGGQSRQVLIATPTMPQPSTRQIMCSMPPLLFKGGNVVQSGSQSHIVNHSNKVILPKPALRHPAPLPQQPVNQNTRPSLKLLPPRPALKISKVQTGIVLSWNMSLSPDHAPIASYQLYAYQESNCPPSTSLWKKVGDVKALPLPMACTLTQFMSGHKYHFAVRAVDLHSRIGPFSFPGTIVLVK